MLNSEALAETGTSKRALARASKEAAILDAAEAIFGAKGYQKTRIGEVASAAGVSRPLFYRTFTDKETLLAAVIERLFKEWNDALVAEAARVTPSTGHTIRLLFLTCLEFARQRPMRLLSPDARRAITGRGVLFNRGSKLLGDLIHEVILRGVERGDVRTDLDLEDLANVITETCIAYSALIIAGHDEHVTTQRKETVVEILLHGIVA
jgi:AcrR family transcriptional regulator